MRGKRLFWRLYGAFLGVTLVAVLILSFFAWNSLQGFQRTRTRDELRGQAELAAFQLHPFLSGGRHGAAREMCREWSARAGARFTVILPDGHVVGDSDEDPDRMDDHAGRPEVRNALAAMVGTSVRSSATVRRRMMYVAVPVMEEGRVLGVVRTALPLVTLQEALGDVRGRLAWTAALVAALAALLTLWLSRHLIRPLEELRRGAERYAEGALDHRIAVPGAAEFADLADALNIMAGRLRERMRDVVQHRNELEAVLGSMAEGVFAVDEEERIISINPAAARLLSLHRETAVGRSIQEVVRNAELQEFVGRSLDSPGPLETDLSVPHQAEERHLQVRSTTLRDADGEAAGTLIVMNDVTRLRRLENMRREFVANVSHELRTPITAVKGFAETLLTGSVESEEKRTQYLQIIDRQADRLQAIFDDLLVLSRTERQVEDGQVDLVDATVEDVLLAAVDLCRAAAKDKSISITVDCKEGLRAELNESLLEQAVYNLLDNAVAYSPEGARVRVKAWRQGEQVAISVEDEGCGIAPEHLPRLFERFYRADRGRGRKTGGTGLGLAIVKHIAEAHRGYVDVESTPDRGSTFTIYIPAD